MRSLSAAKRVKPGRPNLNLSQRFIYFLFQVTVSQGWCIRIRLPIGTLFHHVLTTHRYLIKTLMLFPKIKLGLAALFYSSITQISASLTIKRQATTCNGHSEVSSWFFTAWWHDPDEFGRSFAVGRMAILLTSEPMILMQSGQTILPQTKITIVGGVSLSWNSFHLTGSSHTTVERRSQAATEPGSQ